VISPFRRALSALEAGRIIRVAVALLLRIESVLALVLGVYVVVQTLKLGFSLPTPGTIGSIMAAILLGGAFFAVCQILLYRAASAGRLGESPFTVIPIFSILFRATGEIYATLLATAGIAGCVFTWSSGISPDELVGPFMPPLEIPAENTFLLGLFFMIVSVLAAFGILILFYFLAEAVIIIADIAKNIRSLVKASGVSQS
jgi:heme/copper-type cytochrome/quinol oxidase subunit 3